MKQLTTYILIFFIAFSISAQDGENKTYTKDNYSISYPSDWKLDTSGIGGSLFAISSPLTSSDDGFSENVNLLTQSLKGYGFDLDKYASLNKEQIAQGIPGSKILEDKRVKKEDYEYHMIVISAFMQGRDLKLKQWYIIKDEKAYVLTFTAMKDEYDDFIKTGDQILNSFKIK